MHHVHVFLCIYSSANREIRSVCDGAQRSRPTNSLCDTHMQGSIAVWRPAFSHGPLGSPDRRYSTATDCPIQTHQPAFPQSISHRRLLVVRAKLTHPSWILAELKRTQMPINPLKAVIASDGPGVFIWGQRGPGANPCMGLPQKTKQFANSVYIFPLQKRSKFEDLHTIDPDSWAVCFTVGLSDTLRAFSSQAHAWHRMHWYLPLTGRWQHFSKLK